MDPKRWKKITGVGPTGAVISICLAAVLWWIDGLTGHPEILAGSTHLKFSGMLLVFMGMLLHVWSFWTLRNWWGNDQLCTGGPFRYFRHPMYAAWITWMALGVVLWMNSLIFLLWFPICHPIWHRLVLREERIITDIFGERYIDYAERTGRFFPRIRSFF